MFGGPPAEPKIREVGRASTQASGNDGTRRRDRSGPSGSVLIESFLPISHTIDWCEGERRDGYLG